MTTLIRRETLLHPLDLRTHPRRDALRRDGSLNRLEVVETGRRRRWSAEEKARIVLESMSEPRLIAATSRRYGLSRSLLLTWRKALEADRARPEKNFVRAVVAKDGPVALAAPSSRSATAHSTERRIEIELAGGRRVIVDASVDVEALGRIIEALERR
jgi:transposase